MAAWKYFDRYIQSTLNQTTEQLSILYGIDNNFHEMQNRIIKVCPEWMKCKFVEKQ